MPNSVSAADFRAHQPIGLLRAAQCPHCNQPLVCDDANASFDCCGFEIYQLDCGFCQTSLGGIVDPFDDALLLTARASHADCVLRSA
jgi:hypothetical protein